jgi:transcriptional regulator with XRE-family HTH domain
METHQPRKLRLWRFLNGKPLREVARELRLPAYVVSAIERGEIEPSPRWVQRFEEVYGPVVAGELLAPIDAIEALGPTIGSLGK